MDFSGDPGIEAGQNVVRRRQPPQRKAWVRTLARLRVMITRIAEGDEPTLRGGAHRRRPGEPR